MKGISADGRLDHAYAAVRALCEVALHATGYSVPKGQRQHERVIEPLKFTLGGQRIDQLDYLDRCRCRRHQSLYEHSGVTRQKDADELLAAAKKLQAALPRWLQRNRADLI